MLKQAKAQGLAYIAVMFIRRRESGLIYGEIIAIGGGEEYAGP